MFLSSLFAFPDRLRNIALTCATANPLTDEFVILCIYIYNLPQSILTLNFRISHRRSYHSALCSQCLYVVGTLRPPLHPRVSLFLSRLCLRGGTVTVSRSIVAAAHLNQDQLARVLEGVSDKALDSLVQRILLDTVEASTFPATIPPLLSHLAVSSEVVRTLFTSTLISQRIVGDTRVRALLVHVVCSFSDVFSSAWVRACQVFGDRLFVKHATPKLHEREFVLILISQFPLTDT